MEWPNRPLTAAELMRNTVLVAQKTFYRNALLSAGMAVLAWLARSYLPAPAAGEYIGWQLRVYDWAIGLLPLIVFVPMMQAVQSIIDDRELPLVAWLWKSLSHMPTMVVSYALMSVLIGVGSFLVIPGLYLLVPLMPCLYYSATTLYNPFKAISESLSVTRGLWWYTLIVMCAPAIMLFVFYSFVEYHVIIHVGDTMKLYLTLLMQSLSLWLMIAYVGVAIRQLGIRHELYAAKVALRKAEKERKAKEDAELIG